MSFYGYFGFGILIGVKRREVVKNKLDFRNFELNRFFILRDKLRFCTDYFVFFFKLVSR